MPQNKEQKILVLLKLKDQLNLHILSKAKLSLVMIGIMILHF